jgi:hypothetical protein
VTEPLTAKELLLLGQLAGYSRAEVARMILEADRKRKANPAPVAEQEPEK